MMASVFLAVATYFTFANSQPLDGSSQHSVVLLNLDLAVLLLSSLLVASRVMKFRQRRKTGAASRLHARLVRWFGLLVVTPAIIITLFSATFFNLGIESWFSRHVRAALQKSTSVAQAYLSEHNKNIATDARVMAEQLSRKVLINDPEALSTLLNEQARVHNVNEAVVFSSNGLVLAQTRLSFTLAMKLDHFSQADLMQAREHVMIYHNEAQDRVRALVQVDPNLDVYLIVGRHVDPKVLEHIDETQTAVSEYSRLEKKRHDIEIRFILVFIVFSLLLLLFVIWIGMAFANRLARPIASLISAAEQVTEGNLKVRVPERPDSDEIDLLSQTFNRMTSELDLQRTKLIEANLQIDRRRHFIETVLSGVSAGVVGLDAKMNINIINKSASTLLGVDKQTIQGTSLKDVIPEIAELIQNNEQSAIQSELQVVRDEKTHTLLVRVVKEKEGDLIVGYIVTFDDISLLLTAQRKAAWADVARRVAHEIKNPLTPIQLSAERLKKKYLPQIQEDAENFIRYLETIGRQVEYIGDMVREFSEFARMPEAVMVRENVNHIVEEAFFLQKNAHPHIDFKLNALVPENFIECDPSQITQILTNLILNSIDSIHEFQRTHLDHKGRIDVTLEREGGELAVLVEDNGEGFPVEGREALLEPYVTNREKGTGLGLAIVQRIVDSHRGRLTLGDSELGGAMVKMVFPVSAFHQEEDSHKDKAYLKKAG